MIRLLLILLATAAGPAFAQPQPFSCVGAEQLEDDVFAIPIPRGTTAAAPTALAAATARAVQAPERRICVFGHASRAEGGASTRARLAAARARAIADTLAAEGIQRDRIRAEARVAGFSRPRRGPTGSSPAPAESGATLVLLP